MGANVCRAALEDGPDNERAERLDAAFPGCFCEPWSLTAAGGDGLDDMELVARILTSPDAYDEETSTILTSKLTQIYAVGMSVIRQGASDKEILQTIDDLLTKASEPRSLIGAVLVTAGMFRSHISDDERWFGVYATDDRGKLHHADVLGTSPSGNNSATKKAKSKRRLALANDMLPLVVKETDVNALLSRLRAAGI